MKKKFAAFVLCVICLLSVAGCGQTKARHNDTAGSRIRAWRPTII